MSPQLNKALLVLICGSILAVVGVVDKGASKKPPEPGDTESSRTPEGGEHIATGAAIQPIPAVVLLDPNQVSLGARLFQDPLLSRDGSIACSSCHDLKAGGDDGRSLSIGIDGRLGTLNTPTVFNSGFSFRQFWDGRASTLEDQVDSPIQHAFEMDMNWPDLLERLRADAAYVEAFRLTFGRVPDRAGVKQAIAEFERSLITPDSAFDRYLLGDATAISANQQRGYELFLELGCASCHQGVNLGGNMFQHLGKINDFFSSRGKLSRADQGRFNVTGKERDRFKFKVPTLRNIMETAPYFHDGSVETLQEAVSLMARYQLGHELNPRDIQSLVSFLETLSAELPEGIRAIVQ